MKGVDQLMIGLRWIGDVDGRGGLGGGIYAGIGRTSLASDGDTSEDAGGSGGTSAHGLVHGSHTPGRDVVFIK